MRLGVVSVALCVALLATAGALGLFSGERPASALPVSEVQRGAASRVVSEVGASVDPSSQRMPAAPVTSGSDSSPSSARVALSPASTEPYELRYAGMSAEELLQEAGELNRQLWEAVQEAAEERHRAGRSSADGAAPGIRPGGPLGASVTDASTRAATWVGLPVEEYPELYELRGRTSWVFQRARTTRGE